MRNSTFSIHSLRILSHILILVVGLSVINVAPASGDGMPSPWPFPWNFIQATSGDERPISLHSSARSNFAAPTETAVYRVTSVELDVYSTAPTTLVVFAKGLVTTSGWTNAQLRPVIYIVPPSDGIYEMIFVATPPPSDAIVLPMISPVAASSAVGSLPKDFKGVRVRAATNVLAALIDDTVQPSVSLLGDSELIDVASWIGKTLIRVGRESDATEDDVLETSLPKPYRIFSPDTPTGDMRFDPNRINVVVDEHDTIVSAYWG